ncbi:MAG TPA: LCP family protein [Actinospica sp.]|jgi:LCP family protein required for cell wall assembly|nr:LCP family protein [Actinospica sp.]
MPGRQGAPPRGPGGAGGRGGPGGPRPGGPGDRAAARSPQQAVAAEPEGRINADLDLDEVDPRGRSQRRAAASARPAAGRSRAGKAVRWTALGMSTVLLAAAGVGGYVYVHFNGNIKSAPLLPGGVTQAPEIPNKFGQTAMNILLLGNAGRVSAADCHLGGACDDTATSADSMMVLHLSADRSNMTVMSIPRDSIVDLPSCAGGSPNLINASLVNGPSCSVQTVHDLTGLTIDHFIEVDMAGVVTMSEAVGGVPVCVTNNMQDSYSHIKLPKGTSVIEGTEALAWLRTRHAFSNEVDREEAQHMFLAALVRKLKDNASFTHISTLYSVADSATKALTVDSALSSVTDLLSLAQELGKTPTNRISFMSVPTMAYTGTKSAWRQQLQFDPASANQMFAALKNDQPFTAGSSSSTSTTTTTQTSPAPSTSASTTAPVNVAAVRAEVVNASGISGRASTVRNALVSAGFSNGELSVGNASQKSSTTGVYYPSDRAQSAQAVATALGIPSSAVHQSSAYSEVTVRIGSDWASGSTYSGSGAGASSSGSTSGSTAPTTVASSPPASSLETNGADTKACMYVARPEW